MFVGSSQTKLDIKNRIRMPSKFKEELGTTYYLTRGKRNKCLYVFTTEEFADISKKITAVASMNIANRNLETVFFGSAEKITEDGQGRFVIPQELLNFASIESDVIIYGANTRLEIWAIDKWEEQDEFEDLYGLLSRV